MPGATRRDVLKIGGVGFGVTALGLAVPLGEAVSTADWISTAPKPRRFTRPLPIQSPMAPTRMTDEHGEYLLYELTMRQTELQVLDPGAPTTPVFAYTADGVAPSVPGPLIKVDQNTRVRMRVHNQLPLVHQTFGHEVATSVHLHGSASLPHFDGFADDVTRPGQFKDYWFPNHQGPRTLWYHDHGPHQTAWNVYSGLVAQYHLQNDWEKENLPQGPYDVALTITDALFARSGELAYMDRDHSGLWGDIILVNGVPWPYMDVERRFYRFHVLMSTLSRSMRLRFVNMRTGKVLPTWVVATDGGLMTPRRIGTWRHAGAERYEVMVDLASCEVGDTVELRNLSNNNNRDFKFTDRVLQLRVTSEASDTSRNSVPEPPASELNEVLTAPATLARRTRHIDLEHDDLTNLFLINGKSWADVQAANWNLFLNDRGAAPRPGDYEIWRIENKSGGWFHPLHIHLTDFRILSRRGGAGVVRKWEKGPKDVVYVGEGEIIDVLVHYAMAPTHYPDGRSTGLAGATGALGGRYMIHCHNLPHEDHDMMGLFLVASADGEENLSPGHPNHPMLAAPAQVLEATAPPELVATTPVDGAEGVARGANLTGTFDVDVTTRNWRAAVRLRRVSTGEGVPRAVTYDYGTRTVTVNPDRHLLPGETYTLTFRGTGRNGIRDAAGNRLPNTTVTFTTVLPQVVATTPVDGAVGVARGANLSGTFNIPMTSPNWQAAVRLQSVSTGKSVGRVVKYNTRTRTVTVDPYRFLARNEAYLLTFRGTGRNGIRDAAGNRLPNTTVTFVTRP